MHMIETQGATSMELGSYAILYDFWKSNSQYKNLSLTDLLPIYEKESPNRKHFESVKQGYLSVLKKIEAIGKQHDHYELMTRIGYNLSVAWLTFLVFSIYPIYTILRFVIWAIKVLRGK